MSPELKAFFQRNIPIIESNEIDKLICSEVIEKGLMDELLDFLYDCGGSPSTEVITEQMIAYCVHNNPKFTAEKKEALRLKIRYLINKHQLALVNTIMKDLT